MTNARLDPAVLAALKSRLGTEPRSVRPAGGGCINRCSLIELADGGRVFLKENDAGLAGLFAAEAAGLEALRAAGPLYAPEPLALVESGQQQFLLLEYIEPGRAGRGFFERFGAELAEMHRRTGRRPASRPTTGSGPAPRPTAGWPAGPSFSGGAGWPPSWPWPPPTAGSTRPRSRPASGCWRAWTRFCPSFRSKPCCTAICGAATSWPQATVGRCSSIRPSITATARPTWP